MVSNFSSERFPGNEKGAAGEGNSLLQVRKEVLREFNKLLSAMKIDSGTLN